MATSASPASGILSLPLELMERIVYDMLVDDLHGSVADLAATCKGIYGVVIRQLYKDVGHREPGLIFWAADYGRLDTARHVLATGHNPSRAMRRNESYAIFRERLDNLTPREAYQKLYRYREYLHCNYLMPRPQNPLVPPPAPVDWPPPGPAPAVVIVGHDQPNRPMPITTRLAPAMILGRPFMPFCPDTSSFQPKFTITLPYPPPPGKFQSWELWRPAPPQLARTYFPFWFPIHVAARNGHAEMVQLLLEHGADLDVPSQMACQCEHSMMLWYLVSGIRIPKVPVWTPLHSAICCGQVEVAKLLLDKGASYNVEATGPGVQTTTALHEAARAGLVDLIEYILDRGFQTDINIPNSNGQSPIWTAYLAKQWPAFDLLLSRGANVDDDFGGLGFTPLVDACYAGDWNEAQQLLDRNANAKVVCRGHPNDAAVIQSGIGEYAFPGLRGLRPLDICCRRDKHGSLRGLSPGWEMQPKDFSLLTVDTEMRLMVVKRLLSAGADVGPSFDSPLQAPPLVAASAEHMLSIMHELILHGALVNATDKDGVPPIAAAICYASHCFKTVGQRAMKIYSPSVAPECTGKLARYLLKHGADPKTVIRNSDRVCGKIQDYTDLTLLQTVFWLGEFDLCKELIRAGAEMDVSIWHWMLERMSTYSIFRQGWPRGYGVDADSVAAAFRVIDAVSPEKQATLLADPISLYVAILCNRAPVILRIWDQGLSKEVFQERIEPEMERLFHPHKFPNAGALCLYRAAQSENITALRTLLRFGLDPNEYSRYNGVSPLLSAVDRRSEPLIALLMQHGARLDLFLDDEKDESLDLTKPRSTLNPLRLATRSHDVEMIDTLLLHHKGPISPELRLVCLRDAYRELSASKLRALLEIEAFRTPTDEVPEGTDLPLIELLRDVSEICGGTGRYRRDVMKLGGVNERTGTETSDTDQDSDSDMASGSGRDDDTDETRSERIRPTKATSIPTQMREKRANVSTWIDCIIVFARSGADPTMKNGAGESALDHFGQLLNYCGLDEFMAHVSYMLRFRLGLVLKTSRADTQLDAVVCFRALSELEQSDDWMASLGSLWTYSRTTSSSSSGEFVD
ncbi:ankyrin [Thozetella sp. PMI_491]|nr:ankyrin [Thozetella sp. PMI_491]